MSEENVLEPTKKKSKKKKIIIVIVLILIAALLIWYFLHRDTDNRPTVVNKRNVEQVRKDLNKPITDGSYCVSMSIDWNFENSGTESSNAYIENAEPNKRTVYVDVNLEDGGQLVYSSPYIPVGSTVEQVKLTAELPAGNYPAIVTYHLVDDNKEEITTTAVGVTLHILN